MKKNGGETSTTVEHHESLVQRISTAGGRAILSGFLCSEFTTPLKRQYREQEKERLEEGKGIQRIESFLRG
jgi:hypothetical protein